MKNLFNGEVDYSLNEKENKFQHKPSIRASYSSTKFDHLKRMDMAMQRQSLNLSNQWKEQSLMKLNESIPIGLSIKEIDTENSKLEVILNKVKQKEYEWKVKEDKYKSRIEDLMGENKILSDKLKIAEEREKDRVEKLFLRQKLFIAEYEDSLLKEKNNSRDLKERIKVMEEDYEKVS